MSGTFASTYASIPRERLIAAVASLEEAREKDKERTRRQRLRGPIITGTIGVLLLSATVMWAMLFSGHDADKWNVTVALSSVWVIAVFGSMIWAAVIQIKLGQENIVERVEVMIEAFEIARIDQDETFEAARIDRGEALLEGLEALRGGLEMLRAESEIDRGRVVAMIEQMAASFARAIEAQEKVMADLRGQFEQVAERQQDMDRDLAGVGIWQRQISAKVNGHENGAVLKLRPRSTEDG